MARWGRGARCCLLYTSQPLGSLPRFELILLLVFLSFVHYIVFKVRFPLLSPSSGLPLRLPQGALPKRLCYHNKYSPNCQPLFKLFSRKNLTCGANPAPRTFYAYSCARNHCTVPVSYTHLSLLVFDPRHAPALSGVLHYLTASSLAPG